jgi:5,6-dimethylbenzimidazole synthase
MRSHEFDAAQKEGVYRAIHLRRDVRRQFLPDPVPTDVLARVLHAAHHAPSVGFSQPWNFVVLQDRSIRQTVRASFQRAHEAAAQLFSPEKREQYLSFKLEGILEAPLNLCVTYDPSRFGPVVIGRTSNPMMGIFSSVCAVQTLWLAARAEGLGVGWVSILDEGDLKSAMNLPAGVTPVAYLCLGYVSHFPEAPELETAQWLPRMELQDLVAVDRWEQGCQEAWPSLHQEIHAEAKLLGSRR